MTKARTIRPTVGQRRVVRGRRPHRAQTRTRWRNGEERHDAWTHEANDPPSRRTRQTQTYNHLAVPSATSPVPRCEPGAAAPAAVAGAGPAGLAAGEQSVERVREIRQSDVRLESESLRLAHSRDGRAPASASRMAALA